MFVRSFRLSDYRSCANLLKDVLSEACYTETMEAFARQLSWDSELVLVAELDGEIIGIVIGTIDNNQGCFYRLAVHRGHRHKGVGKALIKGMQQRFTQRKVSRILITADEHNQPILPLYESMGYRNKDFLHSFQKLRIVAG